MTRPIKFRAWDTVWKKMVYGPALAILNLEESTHHLMQFTGLFDKDGKEIYEGDVVVTVSVLIRDVSDPNPHRRIITWNEEEARLDFHWIDGQKQTSGQTFCKKNLENNWQVIGNIHEHPHLLKNV